MRIPVRFLVLIANISLLPATASAQGFPSGYVDPGPILQAASDRHVREFWDWEVETLVPIHGPPMSTAIESCTGLAIENCTLGGGDEPLVRRFLLCSCSLSLRG